MDTHRKLRNVRQENVDKVNKATYARFRFESKHKLCDIPTAKTNRGLVVIV